MRVPLHPEDIQGIPSDVYPSWREGQREAVESILRLTAPLIHVHGSPGSGKTLVNMAAAGLTPGRVLYLTNTRALVDQLSEFGFAPIRGRANYTCTENRSFPTCSRPKEAPQCTSTSCPYAYDLLRARESDRVVTNYSYNALADGLLGEFDLVICDEAHQIESWISRWVEFELPLSDVRRCKINPPAEISSWVPALPTILHFMKELAEESNAAALRQLTSQRATKEAHRLNLLCRRIKHVHETRWICTRIDETAAYFTPDDVSIYARRKVWRDASKVILSSASLLPSTLASLGLRNVARVDLPSTFDYSRRPVYFVTDSPQIKVSRSTSEAAYSTLCVRIEAICEKHKEQKGLILSHSYPLTYRLANTLLCHNRILTHLKGDPPPLDKYRAASYPAILLSPSVGEGVDLPYHDCEFIIWPKVPFADLSDLAVQARSRRVENYSNDLAGVSMIQGCDRGMRAADDWCQVYILDANWTWWNRRVRWPRELRESFGYISTKEISVSPLTRTPACEKLSL